MIYSKSHLTSTKRNLLVLCAAAMLAGCGAVPIEPLSPETSRVVVKKSHAQYFRVEPVTSATISEGMSIQNCRETLTQVLTTSLVNYDYLQPIKSKPAYTINADITTWDPPFFAASIKLPLSVRYKLTDPNGKIVLDKTIDAEGNASISEEWIAVNRGKLAMKRVYEDAATKFMEELNKLNIK